MKAQQKKMLLFVAMPLAVLGAVFWSARLYGTRKAAEISEASAPAPIAIRVAKPTVRDMEVGVSYIGTVYSRKEVKVIARIPGTVAELPFREGERAELGDLVARIDAPEIRAQVERLTVDRDYWARRHEADKRLVEKNALAPEQADAGERSLKTTEAALAEAASQLSKTKEKAPFQGTVLSLFVEPGQSVLPGQPILLFGSGEGDLRVEAAEEDIRRGIGPGTPARIELDSGSVVRTTVAEVSPAAKGQSRTFTVKIPLPARTDGVFRVGSSLRVHFILRSREAALTVPSSAVVAEGPSSFIFLVEGETVRKVPVEKGIESEGRTAVVFSWNGEDDVAVSNLGSLSEGSRVFPVEAEVIK
jgi:RND family efflux transporter MFP subunit